MGAIASASSLWGLAPPERTAALADSLDSMGMADVPYYQRLVRAASGEVLELGAGTGRLTIPLAQVGATLTAVDNERAVLSVLERRLLEVGQSVRARVHVIEADLRTLQLPTRFMLIIVPANTWLLFPSAAERAQVLAVIRAHLHPQGRVVIDIFNATPSDEMLDVWMDDGSAQLGEGMTISRSVRVHRIGETSAQRLGVTQRYTLLGPQGPLEWERSLQLGYLSPQQGRDECEAAGFAVRHIHGDYSGRTEVAADSSRQLYQLRLPLIEREAAITAYQRRSP